MTDTPLTPVQIARIALVRISEKAIPPTPDNYRRFYNEVAGVAEVAQTSYEASHTAVTAAAMLVGDVSETTSSLLNALEGHKEGLHSSIEGLRAHSPAQSLLEVVNEILHTAVAMHQSVDASNSELRLMRDSLQDIRREISSTRATPEHDTLTGARSRFALDGLLRHNLARIRRYQGSLTVAMFDLDHFHHINDQFGTSVGDRFLAHVGEITRSSLRDSDIFVRYGGEEFVILMPETQAPGAKYVLDRLRLILQKTPLIHNGQRLFTTFSAGIAEADHAENHNDLLKRSQVALRKAKEMGRNQVVQAEQAAYK